MQILKVIDPQTNEELKIEASPIKLEDQQGWKISIEGGKETILITDQHGIWKEVDTNNINPSLIPIIGNAIEKQMTSEGF